MKKKTLQEQNLRHNAEFLQPFVNSVHCGTETISYLGTKIWSMIPHIYKNVDGLYKTGYYFKIEAGKLSMQNLQGFYQKYRVL